MFFGMTAVHALLEPRPAGSGIPAQPEGFVALMLHNRRRPALLVPKLPPPFGNWPMSKPVGSNTPLLPKNSVQEPALVRAKPLVTVAVQEAPTTAALDVSWSGAAGTPGWTEIVAVWSATSSIAIEIDVNEPLVVPNVKVASKNAGGQYSSIASVMPWRSVCRIAAEQLTVQERNGHVPASTAPRGLIVPVPWSRNLKP